MSPTVSETDRDAATPHEPVESRLRTIASVIQLLASIPAPVYMVLGMIVAVLWGVLGAAVVILSGLILIQAPFFYVICKSCGMMSREDVPAPAQDQWPPSGPIRR
jgi:ABC-type anion transport system duplicated permease subunit